MPGIELIIFDCDGVLVDSEVVGNRVYADYLTLLGFPHTPEECCAQYLGMSDATVMKQFAERGTPLPDTFKDDVHRLEQAALSVELEPVPGVSAVLAALDVPYCLASSGTWGKINSSLTKTGLDKHFGDNKFCFEQVENGKPAPDLFLFAARAMGFDPDCTLVIEDSRAGVQAGVSAGMTVAGFTGGAHIPPGHDIALRDLGAHHILDRMRGLPELLASTLR